MDLPQRPLSVAIITQNEAERLPACLESVSFANEIVVVDSGSTDQTLAIAKEHGARIFEKSWQGFGVQKQFAMDQCRHRWILLLDADERVPPETAREIGDILQRSSSHAAYSLPRKNFFLGRWIKHGGWWPDRVVRLCDKKACHMSPQLVHESLLVEGSIGELENPLIHFTTRDLQQTIEKINHYSTAGAQELFEKGKTSSISRAVLRSLWGLLFNYIVRRGFLDGPQGLTIAVLDAMNKFIKYAKLKELHDR